MARASTQKQAETESLNNCFAVRGNLCNKNVIFCLKPGLVVVQIIFVLQQRFHVIAINATLEHSLSLPLCTFTPTSQASPLCAPLQMLSVSTTSTLPRWKGDAAPPWGFLTACHICDIGWTKSTFSEGLRNGHLSIRCSGCIWGHGLFRCVIASCDS